MPPFDFDPRNEGLWGDTTSTLDWCEHNYEVGHCRALQTTAVVVVTNYQFEVRKSNIDLFAAKLVYS